MSDARKRKKKYYQSSNKKGRYLEELRPNLKGFLITCNDKNERSAVIEAYRILNEYADIKYGPENLDVVDEVDDDISIEDALQKEVSNIRKANAKNTKRRFQNVTTKAKNVVFIKTNVSDPTNLLEDIFSDLLTSQIKKTRYCLRFLPVEQTCYASPENIIKNSKLLLEPIFVEQATPQIHKFYITWKVRCNNKVKRDDVIQPLVDFISSKVDHVTDYYNPDILVNLDVVGKICFIGLLKNYVKFRKYNIDLIQHPKPSEINGKDIIVNNQKGVPLVDTADIENENENKDILATDNITIDIPSVKVNDDAEIGREEMGDIAEIQCEKVNDSLEIPRVEDVQTAVIKCKEINDIDEIPCEKGNKAAEIPCEKVNNSVEIPRIEDVQTAVIKCKEMSCTDEIPCEKVNDSVEIPRVEYEETSDAAEIPCEKVNVSVEIPRVEAIQTVVVKCKGMSDTDEIPCEKGSKTAEMSCEKVNRE